MKRILLLFVLFFIAQTAVFSQKVTYSDIIREDNRSMNFEILGGFNGNYLVYKNLQRKHRIAIYDKEMNLINTVKLDFISDKTFNVDFITYPDKIIVFYQYQKGSYIYCNAAELDGNAKIIGEEKALDTTKINFFADNQVYFVTSSEDKQKILLYKMLRKNETLSLTTSLFNAALQKIDSTTNVFSYDDRRETYGDLELDNDGTFFYTRTTNKNRSDFITKVEIASHKMNSNNFEIRELPLDENRIMDIDFKIDNMNKLIFINAFTYKKNNTNVEGLLTAVLNKDNLDEKKRAINIFSDSLRTRLTNVNDWRTAYDNFSVKSVVLKKDSGILITMEDYYYTQNRNYNNRWNRNFYDPYYYSNPNYYRFQRNYSYYNWYDPYRNTDRDIQYNYNDLLIFNFSKDMKIEWSNIINKKQSDVETDNFLSFATMNMGSEIHYFFVDKNRQVINDFALQPDGEMKRYATIKSGELGYTFMPRLLKQVSSRQVIVPCLFRNFIGFAKIDFSSN
jgi:hypothetical protein